MKMSGSRHGELGNEATVAAFPLGGIGTGNVSLGTRGELRDWEILNRPDKGNWLPFTFFAIHVASQSGRITRILESEHRAPHEGDSGYHIGKVAGLPRLARSRMRAEYPLAKVSFEDDALPVSVSLTAFTPLVPLNADDSGIPGAVLRYEVHNPGESPVDVTVAGSMANPIAIRDHDCFQFPVYDGTPTVEFRDPDPGDPTAPRGLFFGTDLPAEHVMHGSAALSTTDPSVTVKPRWAIAQWQDGVQLFWDDFAADGKLEAEDTGEVEGLPSGQLPSRQRVGSLGIVHTIKPGDTERFEFLLTWHTGNRSRAWNGMVDLPNTNRDQVVSNHYARRFSDAWGVAEDLASRMDTLETATRDFHGAIFSSSLPPEVIDAISSTLVVIRSTTCFRIDDGTSGGIFAAWEGSFDHQGSCEGTCTHVWNYAQSVASIFPELERNARRTEFLHETLPDGRMRFRSNWVFGGDPHEFHPAVDGQMGTIIRLYREWRFSGDDDFLRELWPNAQRALEYAFSTWDSNGDFVLDSQQHNTYDIEFYGENSLANSMFFAALRAAAAMASHLGDLESSRRYQSVAEIGSSRMDEMLFNGEYFEQKIDDVNAYKYQYGTGCLSDQLFGQTLAHLVGLGYLLPEAHVKSSIAAVFKHNFKTEFHNYDSVQRTYALNDESGLVLCTWPNGGQPRLPFVYSNEVWSGIEYQVATHLIYEGMTQEALTLVRATRDRHDGVRRNPWNEVECGNHYARSMASWGLLIALTGVSWDAPKGNLHLAPRIELFTGPESSAKFFVSTAHGWGTASFDSEGVTFDLISGTLSFETLTADHPVLGRLSLSATTLQAGQSALLTVHKES